MCNDVKSTLDRLQILILTFGEQCYYRLNTCKQLKIKRDEEKIN